MNDKEYKKEFERLKRLQKPIVDRYNRARTKDSKKEIYKEIMEYEKLLWDLELNKRGEK